MPNPVEPAEMEHREEERAAPPPREEPPRPRRRPWLWPALILALILAGIGGFIVHSRLSAPETTDHAQSEGHVTPVSPRVAGVVISVSVTDNQWVEAGAILPQSDPSDYKVAVARASRPRRRHCRRPWSAGERSGG